MSTHANIKIEDNQFNVRSDGWDKQTIRDAVKEYVDEIRDKVKSDYLIIAVLNAITADAATDYYAPFALGYCEFPDYNWIIKLGKRGGVKIKGGRVTA